MPNRISANSEEPALNVNPPEVLPEPALDQLEQLAQDITLRVSKISSDFKISKEVIMQSLNLKVPIYVHRLRRHRPTAWSEALVGMAQDAPPEVKKGGGRKQFNDSYVKWVSENWVDRKEEFAEKAESKQATYRIASDREACMALLAALERQVSLYFPSHINRANLHSAAIQHKVKSKSCVLLFPKLITWIPLMHLRNWFSTFLPI